MFCLLKNLIKPTGACIIRPEKGSKFNTIHWNHIAEKCYDSVKVFLCGWASTRHSPPYFICTESTTGHDNKKAEGWGQ